MSNNTVFRDAYNVPIIIASFGASAVLIYGAVDSPLAQPRNLFGGHIISAIVGVCITRLFVLDPAYMGHLENRAFHPATFINGGLSMATAFLAMQITGTTHPP
jgi:CBS-domain-containing membrane protein